MELGMAIKQEHLNLIHYVLLERTDVYREIEACDTYEHDNGYRSFLLDFPATTSRIAEAEKFF